MVEQGQRYKRVRGPKRERGRVAFVVRVHGDPWNLVEYRYLYPLPGAKGYGSARGLIQGRTNTTSMGTRDFEATFEKTEN